jgi:hypothetical protein
VSISPFGRVRVSMLPTPMNGRTRLSSTSARARTWWPTERSLS